MAIIRVLLLLTVVLVSVQGFQVERSVVDWMTYAKDHDLWKSKYQKDVQEHHLRPPAVSKTSMYSDLDRTWMFPDPSKVLVKKSKKKMMPSDLSFEERVFQTMSTPPSFQRFKGHNDYAPYTSEEHMWRSHPVNHQDKFPTDLTDEDRSFWWKNHQEEYLHQRLED